MCHLLGGLWGLPFKNDFKDLSLGFAFFLWSLLTKDSRLFTRESFRYGYLCGIVSRPSNICGEVWWKMSRPVQILPAPEKSRRLRGPFQNPCSVLLSLRGNPLNLCQTEWAHWRDLCGFTSWDAPDVATAGSDHSTFMRGTVESHWPHSQEHWTPALGLLLTCWATLASHWPSLGSDFLNFKRRWLSKMSSKIPCFGPTSL